MSNSRKIDPFGSRSRRNSNDARSNSSSRIVPPDSTARSAVRIRTSCTETVPCSVIRTRKVLSCASLEIRMISISTICDQSTLYTSTPPLARKSRLAFYGIRYALQRLSLVPIHHFSHHNVDITDPYRGSSIDAAGYAGS